MKEEKEIKQDRRFTEVEMSIIRSYFKDDEDTNLKAIRAYMFGFSPLKEDINNEEVFNILKKTMLPTIDKEAPIGQIVDLYMTIPLENISEEERDKNVKIKEMVIGYLSNKLLKIDGEEFDINNMKGMERLRARNFYLILVEQQLVQLKVLANLPTDKLISPFTSNK